MGFLKSSYNCVICGNDSEFDNFTVLENKMIVCNKCCEKIANAVGLYRGKSDVAKTDVKRASDEELADTTRKSGFPNPKEIKMELDKYVVGQDEAKKVLSVAAYNHYKRTTLDKPGLQKSNVLMLGPSGSGKTYLMKILARTLQVPLAIVSATNLTESGYVGDDVNTVIEALLSASNNEVERAEKGIVFIDEIDKLAVGSSASKEKVGGKGVQQALLPIIEGTKVMVTVGSKGAASYKVEVDTTNILFVCGGAFPDLEPVIKRRITGASTIGFRTTNDFSSEETPSHDLLLYACVDDLKSYGFIPEFLGRLPIITALRELSVDTLKRILYEPEDSIVSQFQTLFLFDGVSLNFEESALLFIAKKAASIGTGARSLRSIMEGILLELQYQVPGSSAKSILITESFVKGDSKEPVIE